MALLLLWIAERMGAAVRKKTEEMNEEEREDFGVILAATLTLLGLIIGFSFSMAISRYDQRKNLEEEEANAIGTEYLRVELVASGECGESARIAEGLSRAAILFYETRWVRDLVAINTRTAELQTELWSAVKGPAETERSAVQALTVWG